MTCILAQVRGSLPAAATEFLRFVISLAARAAPLGEGLSAEEPPQLPGSRW